ncbi:MAG: biotin/lipoyl-binding protein, partial [Stellaceae bacterium]
MRGGPASVLPPRGSGRRSAHGPWPALPERAPNSDRDAADREFLPVVLEIVETPPARSRAVLGYAICGLLAVSLIGLWLGWLPIFAVAPGQVAAVGQAKVIEPRETGQVKTIAVANGARVKAGQVLVTLDPTAALANRAIVENKLIAAHADQARLKAEIAAGGAAQIDAKPAVAWPADIPAAIRAREQGILEADLT